ncbi:class I SAM-dependent methyltransferase [Sandaracinobacter neustonicus]|uniref:Class I SAM-dependent methyltransferase n=2 Tax=Sandaracinobacter neustonicus TaxID=1715348 RepID=A0A501XTR8_9SPHN|nr:class I SAM-dependent methyltransferase [Sandaracinobacter neustonicus]
MGGWWDRHMVPRLIGFCCSQPPVMKLRAGIVPLAEGDVLELGAGGGANLAVYDRAKVRRVTGIDPSDGLIALANERMAQADRGFFQLEKGVAEELPFPTARFDTVLCTFTLCSVQDPARALAEAKRVLKPGGRLLFLEHGLSPHDDVRKWQRRIEPLWKPIAGGCHLTRPVTDSVTAAGFHVAARNGGYMEKSPKFAAWVEWGEARPA